MRQVVGDLHLKSLATYAGNLLFFFFFFFSTLEPRVE